MFYDILASILTDMDFSCCVECESALGVHGWHKQISVTFTIEFRVFFINDQSDSAVLIHHPVPQWPPIFTPSYSDSSSITNWINSGNRSGCNKQPCFTALMILTPLVVPSLTLTTAGGVQYNCVVPLMTLSSSPYFFDFSNKRLCLTVLRQ